MKSIVTTTEAPRPIGPFSQAVRAGGFVFVAGQVGVDGGDIAGQTERALKNVEAILKAAGLGLQHVVRAGVYLRRMDDFAAMNAVYAKFFPSEPPARTTIEVSRLPVDALVEIDVVALMA